MMQLKISNLLNRGLRILPPREAYELWANTYDNQAGNALLFAEERYVAPLVDALDMSGASVVDFGCGTGRYLRRALSKGARLILGIDFSRNMLRVASEKYGNETLSLIQSDLRQLPLSPDMFDIGISTLALGSLPDLQEPISEMCRVLKRGGTLLISEFHPVADGRGWKRTFCLDSHGGPQGTVAVQNYSRPLDDYVKAFESNKMEVEIKAEPAIDDSMEPFFLKAGMAREYREALGTPILFILRLRKR